MTESASQIARRLRAGTPPERPVVVREIQPCGPEGLHLLSSPRRTPSPEEPGQ